MRLICFIACSVLILMGVGCSKKTKASAQNASTVAGDGIKGDSPSPNQYNLNQTQFVSAKATPSIDIEKERAFFTKEVRPFLDAYCGACHNNEKQSAGLTLEGYTTFDGAKKDRSVWEKIKEELETKHMPPKRKTQPSDEVRKKIVDWIEETILKVDCGLARDPGRPTIRRLNKAEYNNTIRDLLGVNFKPADDFPSDDVGYGFDNIGDVLTLPPLLFEKYLAAADKILNSVNVISKPITPVKETLRPQNVRSTLGPDSKQRDRIYLYSNGAAVHNYEFLHEGEYVFRAKAFGDQAGTELPKMSIDLDKKSIKVIEVDAVQGKSKFYEAKAKVSAGRHEIAFAFINDFLDRNNPDPTKRDRNLSIELIEIEGPFNVSPQSMPSALQKVFFVTPDQAGGPDKAARAILEKFMMRAYRRPVTVSEVDRVMKLYHHSKNQGEKYEQSLKFAMKGVLVSPHFLFRVEVDQEPENPLAIHPVSDYELATRLSYFLWSSMPDEELFDLAGRKELRKPQVLEAQVKRMLKDPKSEALTKNFAGQWLMLRTLETLTPDRKTYPNYDNNLRDAMIRETELFFEHIVKNDRSILEFLDADYTFVNGALAKHYGIKGISGSDFQKVTLTDKNRGGVITQASVLTVTSNPTRTSPVKRGKWILENILGTPPPPPPPDVPELEEKGEKLTGSLRERMEKHRENAACASCHAKMDPLGFGLENFDGVGGWRTQDGQHKIEPAGELPDGSKFAGPAELRQVLLKKADLFRKNFADRLLTYAVGRGMEYYDKCSLDDLVLASKNNGDRFSALVLAIVKSDTFQKRRGGTGVPTK